MVDCAEIAHWHGKKKNCESTTAGKHTRGAASIRRPPPPILLLLDELCTQHREFSRPFFLTSPAIAPPIAIQTGTVSMAAPASASKTPEVARSESTESSSGDEAEWLDAEPENEEPLTVESLVDDTVFTDVKSMLDHCRDTTGFDFIAVRNQLSLDFYGSIKLVNFSKTARRCPTP